MILSFDRIRGACTLRERSGSGVGRGRPDERGTGDSLRYRNFPLAYLLMGLPGLLANRPTSRREHPTILGRLSGSESALSPTSLSVIDQGPRGVDVYTQASRPGRLPQAGSGTKAGKRRPFATFCHPLEAVPARHDPCSIIPLRRARQNAGPARCKKVWV